MEPGCKLLPASKRQSIKGIHYRGMFHVERCQTLVGSQVKRIGDKPRGISGRSLIQGIAVIQSLRKGVNTAEGKSVAESPLHFGLQRVIGAVAAREPSPGISERGIGSWPSSRNEVGTCRDGSASKRGREIRGKSRGARRSRANCRRGLVGIDADQFVVAVGTDIAYREGGIRREIALNPQGPGDECWSLHVWLNAARNELRARRNWNGGIDGEVRNWQREAINGIEWRVLIGSVAERVLQIVVHAESSAEDGLWSEGTPS